MPDNRRKSQIFGIDRIDENAVLEHSDIRPYIMPPNFKTMSIKHLPNGVPGSLTTGNKETLEQSTLVQPSALMMIEACQEIDKALTDNNNNSDGHLPVKSFNDQNGKVKPTVESEEERRQREERENAEKNELSLIRILTKHNEKIQVQGNYNFFKRNDSGFLDLPQSISEDTSAIITDDDEEFFNSREFRRTVSMVSCGPSMAKTEVMTKRYKIITASVLWFCYFSLALNDYIFGPTFNDLSQILETEFKRIAYFVVYRQCAYTLGSLGGLAFDYVNRQFILIVLLLLSSVSLVLTPLVPNLEWFFLIAVVNGFSAGACDVGFHVWILEMFQNGGGPLLQALHFSFGLGVAIAPLISAQFLSHESNCNAGSGDHHQHSNLSMYHYSSSPESKLHSLIMTVFSASKPVLQEEEEEISEKRARILIPYLITAVIVGLGAIFLLVMFFYKRYIPPKERKLPVSFDAQMPKQLTRSEKLEVWKRSVPSFYMILLIGIGSLQLLSYYGLEVTYFQFLAQFSNALPLNFSGTDSANLEAATGSAYAFGGLLATFLSFRLAPERMIYVNFVFQNVGSLILLFYSKSSTSLFWIGNVLVGLGFSSCYATAYTFLEHQINVTNFIGSMLLFASGAGTAIQPLFLTDICQKPLYLVFLSLFAINLSFLLFVLMHLITNVRKKQVKLLQQRFMKDAALLTKIRIRTLSTLSNDSRFDKIQFR